MQTEVVKLLLCNIRTVVASAASVRVWSTPVCDAFGSARSTVHQSVMPLALSGLDQSILPLNMFVLHHSLFFPWMCPVYSN
jgi:hypothetical protein